MRETDIETCCTVRILLKLVSENDHKYRKTGKMRGTLNCKVMPNQLKNLIGSNKLVYQ
jgi:hypothetical protein